MTSTTDPWAAASAGQAQGNGNTPAGQTGARTETVPDRMAEQRAIDPNADPFATPDELGGQSGPRGPHWQDILERLVVLKPVQKLIDQEVKGDTSGKVQTFYSVDLTVLDGGQLTVVTPAKVLDNGTEYPEQVNTFEVPYTFTGWYAYGKGITVKLDNLNGKPLLLGVVRRCPTGPGYRSGKTPDDTAREWAKWEQDMRTDPSRYANAKPQFSWGVVDPTPEQREVALRWYRSQAG